MGLHIKKLEDKYQIYSSNTGELIHDEEWLTQDQVKKVLIEREFREFLDKMIQIDMEFPFHYYVNDRLCMERPKEFFSSWWLESKGSKVPEKAGKVVERLEIDLRI